MVNSPMLECPLVIVGGGPAAYTAALYGARAGLNPVLIRGSEPGGQLMLTTLVENYPGFPSGIQGPELMEHMHQQCLFFGTRVFDVNVTKMDLHQRPFICYTDKLIFKADAAILATGASAKWLGLESESFFRGYGVSSCATCDGFLFRGEDVAVIGGGNTAVEEALFLTRHARSVCLIHRRDSLRAERILQQRLRDNPKTRVIWSCVIEEILGEREPVRSVKGLKIRHVSTHKIDQIDVTGVFVAIGHSPASQLVAGQVALDAQGYISNAADGLGNETGGLASTRTNIPGFFAAGDVRDAVYRQAITAAAQGCMAALDAERFLLTQGQF